MVVLLVVLVAATAIAVAARMRHPPDAEPVGRGGAVGCMPRGEEDDPGSCVRLYQALLRESELSPADSAKAGIEVALTFPLNGYWVEQDGSVRRQGIER